MKEKDENNGIKYRKEQKEDKITLKKKKKKHKMWVALHFPKGNQVEGKQLEGEIINILSNQFIERHAMAANDAV
jgi:hypothetical protein